jgi:hypothetical protein
MVFHHSERILPNLNEIGLLYNDDCMFCTQTSPALGLSMRIERVIFFITLGFFVFSPQIPGWRDGQHLFDWYGYYLPALIFLVIVGWTLFSRNKESRNKQSRNKQSQNKPHS